MAATAEGGGGTAPAAAEHLGAAAQAAAAGGQLQQRQRAAPGRGMAVAPSVRQLALQQRRQLSRIAAADAAEPPRAESSRPAHWQMHPTSSTLRSPLYEVRQLHATLRQRQQAQLGASVAVQQEQQAEHEVASDSEAASEGASPEGQQVQQGVRRSRRIMRRRRDAAELEQQQQDAAHAEEADQAAGMVAEDEVQQPAVSGVAEAAAGPHSCSDSEHPDVESPATRRRVRRRTGAAAADHAAAREQAEGGRAAAAAAEGSGGGGGFKAPAGRSPLHRRQAGGAAAVMNRLDSTVGLLHHHPLQHETSEVAARGGGHVQQEATVSQRQPAAAGAHCPPERSLAAEVNSRPVLSASQVGLATQLGSQEAGHEASSLNSGGQGADGWVAMCCVFTRAVCVRSPRFRCGAMMVCSPHPAPACLQLSSRLMSGWAAWRSVAGQMPPQSATLRWPPPQQQAGGRVVQEGPQPSSSSGSSRPRQTAGRRARATGDRVPAQNAWCRRRPSLPRLLRCSSRASWRMAHAREATCSPLPAQEHRAQFPQPISSSSSSSRGTCLQQPAAVWSPACGDIARQTAVQQWKQQVLERWAARQPLLLTSSSSSRRGRCRQAHRARQHLHCCSRSRPCCRAGAPLCWVTSCRLARTSQWIQQRSSSSSSSRARAVQPAASGVQRSSRHRRGSGQEGSRRGGTLHGDGRWTATSAPLWLGRVSALACVPRAACGCSCCRGMAVCLAAPYATGQITIWQQRHDLCFRQTRIPGTMHPAVGRPCCRGGGRGGERTAHVPALLRRPPQPVWPGRRRRGAAGTAAGVPGRPLRCAAGGVSLLQL